MNKEIHHSEKNLSNSLNLFDSVHGNSSGLMLANNVTSIISTMQKLKELSSFTCDLFSNLLKESEKIAERINNSRKRYVKCVEIIVENSKSAPGVNVLKRTEEPSAASGVTFNYDFQVLTSLYPIPKLIHDARSRTEQAPTFSALEDFFDSREIQHEYTYPNGLYVLWLIEHRERMKANNKRRRLRRLTRIQQRKRNVSCTVNKKLSLRVTGKPLQGTPPVNDAPQNTAQGNSIIFENALLGLKEEDQDGVESSTVVSREVTWAEPGMDVNLRSHGDDSVLSLSNIPPPPPLPPLVSLKSYKPPTSEVTIGSQTEQRSNIGKIFDEMKGVVLKNAPREKVQTALRSKTPRDRLMEEIRSFESMKLRKAEVEQQQRDFKTIVSSGPIDILKVIELHQDNNSTDTWSDDSDDDGW